MPYEVPDFPAGSLHFASCADVRAPTAAATGVAETVGAVQRASLERFIAARFAQAYAARGDHYCVHLVGIRTANGAWRAAVGYTGAHEGSLYLEHYLDQPVESAIAAVTRRHIARERIVEVGNLAATSPGAAREIIRAMGAHLRRAGFAWVTFTATRELRNTFTRLGLNLRLLGPADPRRVPGGGAEWGRYYAHDPAVVFGEIGETSGGAR